MLSFLPFSFLVLLLFKTRSAGTSLKRHPPWESNVEVTERLPQAAQICLRYLLIYLTRQRDDPATTLFFFHFSPFS